METAEPLPTSTPYPTYTPNATVNNSNNVAQNTTKTSENLIYSLNLTRYKEGDIPKDMAIS